VAVSGITSAIWNHQLRPEQKQDLFVRLLSAIKSEVEGITGDNEGIYFNVSLLSLDANGGTLTVVCRANPDRPLRSYRVEEMLVSQTLSTGKMFYEPDCKLADKPYKAILGMPLVSVHENCKPLVHGIVSIDSAQAHCFDGLLEDIENKTKRLAVVKGGKMNGNAKLKDSTSPQMIIEKLARKRISEEEAEKTLQQQWVRVYDTPTVVRFLQEIFQNGANRRISK
jgi:hypothetical protein